MAKLILHVGMPKTGSSYIQGMLNKNYQVIEAASNINLLGGIQPHLLACHLITDDRLIERSDINDLRNKYTEEIESTLIHKSKSTNVLVSSEYFILCDKKVILEYFSKFFDSIEIIIAVRRQDKLIASGFNQDVKALGRSSNLVWEQSNSQHMDYWEYCEQWCDFGIPVRVIDYDHVKKDDNGLLKSFFSICNINYSNVADLLVSPGNSSSNYSLTHQEVLLKLAMNRAGINGELDLLEAFHKKMKVKQEFKLPIAYENVIASHYKDSNQRFVAKYLDNNLHSELNFHNIESNQKHSSFSWNPLNGIDEVFEFMLNEIISEKK
jgi:hypothetical protein